MPRKQTQLCFTLAKLRRLRGENLYHPPLSTGHGGSVRRISQSIHKHTSADAQVGVPVTIHFGFPGISLAWRPVTSAASHIAVSHGETMRKRPQRPVPPRTVRVGLSVGLRCDSDAGPVTWGASDRGSPVLRSSSRSKRGYVMASHQGLHQQLSYLWWQVLAEIMLLGFSESPHRTTEAPTMRVRERKATGSATARTHTQSHTYRATHTHTQNTQPRTLARIRYSSSRPHGTACLRRQTRRSVTLGPHSSGLARFHCGSSGGKFAVSLSTWAYNAATQCLTRRELISAASAWACETGWSGFDHIARLAGLPHAAP